MAKWILAAGAAALALSSPALAGPDKGHGGGKERGGQTAERGGGKHDGQRGGHRAERRGGGDDRKARGHGRGHKAERHARRDDDDRGKDRVRVARVDRDDDRKMMRRERRHERREVRIERRDDDRRFARDDYDREVIDLRRDDGRRFSAFDGRRDRNGPFDDCPPGLAKKDNGCMPPGQAKKWIGAALPVALGSQLLEGPFRQWYRDDDRYYYRGDGGYIYRVDRQGGLVNALFPYQDRDFSYYDVGSPYPADYNFYNVPQQYQSYYADGGDYAYRYGDGAIYQVDRSNNLISSIVALLAGDLAVGERLPSDYGVYNVPLAFRDRYYDTPEALYRYNDGYIYQANPKTQLITAVIDALV